MPHAGDKGVCMTNAMNILYAALLAVLPVGAQTTPAPQKVYEMRVTGYVANGEKGALAIPVMPGRHAAVSPMCIELLGERVYIRGHGMFTVVDLAADWLDVQRGICTIDIAKPNQKTAQAVGNRKSTVVVINQKNITEE